METYFSKTMSERSKNGRMKFGGRDVKRKRRKQWKDIKERIKHKFCQD